MSPLILSALAESAAVLVERLLTLGLLVEVCFSSRQRVKGNPLMNEEILEAFTAAITAAFAAGFTEGVETSEAGFVCDAESAANEWIESEGAQDLLRVAASAQSPSPGMSL